MNAIEDLAVTSGPLDQAALLTRRDLAGLFELACALPAGTPEAEAARIAVDGLRWLVDCDELGYSILDTSRRTATYIGTSDGGDADLFWEIESRHPLCRAAEPVIFLSDTLRGIRLRNAPIYREWYGPIGITDEAKVTLTCAGSTITRAFMLSRSGGVPFDEHDRAVLHAVRRLLRRSLAPELRTPGLTAREQEVMSQVMRGLTNKEIAVCLCISRDTVRTHLENIFAKLGVHTRAAAIARVR